VAATGRRWRPLRSAAAGHRRGLIQDIGQDQLRESGFEDTHPLWIVRRTIIDLINPIEFQDMLRLRRWCSATSTRWCEKRVRIDGRKGGLIESEAFWININPDTLMPSRINDDFLKRLHCATDVHRLRWRSCLTPGDRENATQIRYYPVRVIDIDLFNHMNNSVYWSVVENYLSATPELLRGPIRVTIEHEAPIALGRQAGDHRPRPSRRFHRQVRTRTGRPDCHHTHIRQRRRNQGHRIHLRPIAG
jgi:acyl-ACP thioesterase